MNVLFVIPPINKRWADYTDLPQDMYLRFAKKIKIQLRNQGFSHILDLSGQGGVRYFMQDTIHLGWRGWVAMDRAVEPFLRDKEPAPEYQIDPYYYSEDWRQKVERWGALNYPEAARGKLYGALVLTVTLDKNGNILDIHIDHPSPHKVLNDAAYRIVKDAGPYAPFSPAISRDTDQLVITRTWTFTKGDSIETR
jgi:TonB family protein